MLKDRSFYLQKRGIKEYQLLLDEELRNRQVYQNRIKDYKEYIIINGCICLAIPLIDLFLSIGRSSLLINVIAVYYEVFSLLVFIACLFYVIKYSIKLYLAGDSYFAIQFAESRKKKTITQLIFDTNVRISHLEAKINNLKEKEDSNVEI